MANLRKLFGLGLLLILAGCRQEMYDQSRCKPLAQSDFYSDLRSARPQVEGTVARGQLHEDTYFYTGKIGANPGDYMPFPVTDRSFGPRAASASIFIARLAIRGWATAMAWCRSADIKHPPTYHQDRLRKAPLGYFFDVMTNGFGAMPDYSAQIPPRDRWCIVAYIRALQLSQNATPADVAAGAKVPSTPPRVQRAGIGRDGSYAAAASRALQEMRRNDGAH